MFQVQVATKSLKVTGISNKIDESEYDMTMKIQTGVAIIPATISVVTITNMFTMAFG